MMSQAAPSKATPPGPNTPDALPQVQWQHRPGADVVLVERPPVRELHLTLNPKPDEPIGHLVQRLSELLRQHRAAVVRQFVFGSLSAHAETLRAMAASLGGIDWPVVWVEGAGCAGCSIAGIQVHALAGAPIQTLRLRGRIVGRIFDDNAARHCLLGDLGSRPTTAFAPRQAREMFDELEAALDLAGMSVRDVVRTWLFLDDLLSWYEPFNQVRNAFFARHELSPGSFPASTGVGGRNPHGSALVAGAWAVRPHAGSTRVCRVPSPKQCPAPAYGSAFSRAVEILSPQLHQLLISGTASIAPDGRTAHAGDTQAQMDLTLQVVEAILASRGMSFANVSLATAYFQSPAEAPLFENWLARRKLRAMPVVRACCGICREDLRFEIDLHAVRAGA